MKKTIYLLLLLMTILLAACTEQTGTNNNTADSSNTANAADTTNATSQDQSGTASDVHMDKPLENFNEMLLDDSLKPQDLLKYIKQNINSASPDEMTNLLLRLEVLQKNNLGALTDSYNSEGAIQDKLAQLYPHGIIPANTDTVKDAELREFLTDVRDNGFKTETAEGSFFPVIDYGIYKEFLTYLPEDIRDYYSLMAVESDRMPARDAEMAIGWDEVIKRAIDQEQFILSFEQSQKRNEVQSLYNKYVSFIFNGLPNTPDFIYATKSFDPQLKQSLISAAKRKGNTLLEQTISDYLNVLDKNKYRLTDEVKKFRENAIATLSK